jgi:hypothetical protein
MLPALLLCSTMFFTDSEPPASALVAVENAALARLPDYFGEPDPEAAALFAMPVAKVNGQAILVGTALSNYDDYLQHARGRISKEEYAQVVQEIIRRELPRLIFAEAVWSDVQAHVPADAESAARRRIDALW